MSLKVARIDARGWLPIWSRAIVLEICSACCLIRLVFAFYAYCLFGLLLFMLIAE
jgi:hypothetical protein